MKTSLGAQTLIFPTPVWCVGSYDKGGKPNIMTIAWGGICCSTPPCLTISLRKTRYTYENILERGAYTVSVPPEKYAAEADYFGIVSGRDENKFQKTGLTPTRSKLVDAPYVEEFHMVLECKLLHHYEIGIHTQFIGEIMDVKVDESVLDEDGKPAILLVSPLVYETKSHFYHGIGGQIGKAFDIGRKFG
ncbi:MAG: flavin reductase family protein [Anaerolineales bacterium]|nr:flavin reductase family protein [Anaerolineales bacterium]